MICCKTPLLTPMKKSSYSMWNMHFLPCSNIILVETNTRVRLTTSGAQVWLTCQEWNATGTIELLGVFKLAEMRSFYDLLHTNRYDWLTGVVYGPHTRFYSSKFD